MNQHELILLSPCRFPGQHALTLADEDEAYWLALFRQVDLFQVKTNLYRKFGVEKGRTQKLYLLAFQWVEYALMKSPGPGIDKASWLVAEMGYHATRFPDGDPHFKGWMEIKLNEAVSRLIIQEVIDTLRKQWVKENRPDLLSL